MKETLRKVIYLVGMERPSRWVLVIGIAFVTGVLEIFGAFLVLLLLATMTGSPQAADLPLVGNPQERLGFESDETFLLFLAGMITAFFVLRAFFFMLQSYIQNRFAQNAGVRLSTRLLEGYLKMPFESFLHRHSSSLIRNVHHAVWDVVHSVFLPIIALASEILLTLGLVSALLIAAPTGTLIAILVLAPVLFVTMRILQPRMSRLGEAAHHLVQQILQQLQEAFSGARDIRVMGRESLFTEQFARSRRELARNLYIRAMISEFPRVSVETMLVMFILLFLVVTVVGGQPVEEGLAVLGLFAYAGLRLIPSLNRIAVNMNNIKYGGAAVDELYRDFHLLTALPSESSDSKKIRRHVFESELRLNNVTFRFQGTDEPVLHNVSMVIQPGDSVGLAGPTGAGKSTLVDLILGLLEPTSGTIMVDGMDLREHRNAWQMNIGAVHQTVFLLDASLRHNIVMGSEEIVVDEERLQESIQMAQLDEFVGMLPDGVDTCIGERGVRLSGGERQRVAIARALYQDAPVLIFDEGTSALDSRTEARLMEAILAERSDRTFIIVAHRMTSLQKCSKVFLLEEGRFQDSGSFDELVARNETFRELAHGIP